ncbi:MAG TPA: glutathione S-transferase N-terminal domain-containing protein [Myxococcota bacterium]|nr:glutathione S-transferase N-terminal domain-containing protein [Myxococcota bacterium]
MKLYNENMPAPNPRRVRMFAAEKGISLPLVRVELAKREHKSAEHLARNALGQVPTLELDDGSTISESVSICRYLEALYPAPPLFGRTPKEIGLVDMWIRRVELQLGVPLGAYWINCHPYTEPYAKAMGITRFGDYGEASRLRAIDRLEWLDGQLESEFLAGDFSAADLIALSLVDFAAFIGIAIPERATRLRAWHERVSKRPSASA